MFVGTSGSGKTTLAQAAAERMGVRYVSNDEIIHGPNWVPKTKEQRLRLFEEATRGDAWTIDGNFGQHDRAEDGVVLGRADTLVWLDLPRWLVMWQVWWRTMRRCALREELWHGNRETFRLALFSKDSILLWAWTTHARRQRRFGEIHGGDEWPHLEKVRLRSRREMRDFLQRLSPEVAARREVVGSEA